MTTRSADQEPAGPASTSTATRRPLYGLSAVDIKRRLQWLRPELDIHDLRPNGQYKVLLEVLPKYQEHMDLFSQLYFKSPETQLVPLDAFAKVTTRSRAAEHQPLRAAALRNDLVRFEAGCFFGRCGG